MAFLCVGIRNRRLRIAGGPVSALSYRIEG
jgi:hypothetical protein